MNPLKKAIAVLTGLAVINPFMAAKNLEDRLKENNHFQKIQVVQRLQETMGGSSWSEVLECKDSEDCYTQKAEAYRAKALEVCADKPDSKLGRCFDHQTRAAKLELQRAYAQNINDHLREWKDFFSGDLTSEGEKALSDLIRRTVTEPYHKIYDRECINLKDLDLSPLGISSERRDSLEQEINKMCTPLGIAHRFYLKTYQRVADNPFRNPCFDKDGWENNCPGPVLLPYTMDTNGYSYSEGSDEADFLIYKNIYHQQLSKILAKYGLNLDLPLTPVLDPKKFAEANNLFLSFVSMNFSYQQGERKPKAKRKDPSNALGNGLYDKLRTVGIPEENIPAIIESLGKFGGEGVSKTTDKTYSQCVFRSKVEKEGQTYPVFGKVGKLNIQRQQAAYFERAAQVPLLRPITPQLVELIEDPALNVAIQLTYDTSDKRIVPKEEVRDYLKTRGAALRYLGKITKTSPLELERDPLAIDCFNIALNHTYMREHLADPLFGTSLSYFEEARSLERLSYLSKSDDYHSALATKLVQEYARTEEEVKEFLQKKSVLALGDCRAENIFADAYHGRIRIIGDPMPRPGTEIFDLSRMGLTPEMAKKAVEYTFILRNYLEQQKGENFEVSGEEIRAQQDKLMKLNLIQPAFLADYFLQKGRTEDASALLKNASLYLHSRLS